MTISINVADHSNKLRMKPLAGVILLALGAAAIFAASLLHSMYYLHDPTTPTTTTDNHHDNYPDMATTTPISNRILDAIVTATQKVQMSKLSKSPTTMPISSNQTSNQTQKPVSKFPTMKPTTKPTSNRLTMQPITLKPISKRPTMKPTIKPVSKVPTMKPTSTPKPTSKRPTMKPNTLKPISKSPTMKPSISKPISKRPTMKPISTVKPMLMPIPPSKRPTMKPTPMPLSKTPTNTPGTVKPTIRTPTSKPSISKPTEPSNPKPTYFNYNITAGALYGPFAWGNVNTINNYWSEFGFVKNQCMDPAVMQSPIDVCTAPKKYCLEYHEPRAKGGNFRLTDQYMTKRILPNKLHIHVIRKVVNQTLLPPSFDFSGVGFGALDLLNIDIKFPSEHTVCGRRFDGEMQYYFYHPVKNSFIVVAWLFEANVANPMNIHMQRLIDEFQEIYDINEEICRQKSVNGSMAMSQPSSSVLVVEPRWNPFHRDIQKTIHFWGYSGSLTEPPCVGDTLWRIMDVPVQLSMDQLNQMKNILFNNRDSRTCEFTSNHYKGSVARPINKPLPYYKCTRQDYKSDDERELCGDNGCAIPFSTHLDPWVPPIVYVTEPPSFAPTEVPTY